MCEANMIAKVVQSGDFVEYYYYTEPILCGRDREYAVARRSNPDATKRKDNVYRSRFSVRRLIWCNQTPYTKFVTLTYADTVLDVKTVLRAVKTFVQRMRRNGYEMKYLYVLEHQTLRGLKEGNAGCFHVHMIIFNDQYVDCSILAERWGHGFVKINALENVRNVGAYICKYITKENMAEFGKHVYGVSRGLNRPSVERFYSEGFSDTTTGLHPVSVYGALADHFNSSVTHDYRDREGFSHSQTVFYAQGKWKDGNIIERNCDDA